MQDLSSRGQDERDNKRVADLRSAQKYIQTYYHDTGKDPLITLEFPQKESRWDIIKRTLVDGARAARLSSSYRQGIEKHFPALSKDDDPFLYDYRSDSFGKSYLLSVRLENSARKSLQNDLDGIVLGVDCRDPMLCIGQGPATKAAAVPRQFANGRLIRPFGDYKIYLIQGDRKRWIVNPEVFRAHRFNWSNVETVAPEDASFYETEIPLTA